MKGGTDEILSDDPKLQILFKWVSKGNSYTHRDNLRDRAFYFALARQLIDCLIYSVDAKNFYQGGVDSTYFSLDSLEDYIIENDLERYSFTRWSGSGDSAKSNAAAFSYNCENPSWQTDVTSLVSALTLVHTLAPNSKFETDLSELIHELPYRGVLTLNNYHEWWKMNGSSWLEKLTGVMNEHRTTGYDWRLTQLEKERLRIYHEANRTLINCLRAASRDTRQDIEKTLFLPIAEIEKYNREQDKP